MAVSFSNDSPLIRIRVTRRWRPIDVAEIWQFRDLLTTLAGRDVKLRYRQTALGVVWVILQPLLAAGIFALVFGKVAKLPSGGVPYFLFSYAGLLCWNASSSTVTKASTCLTGNSQLISKIYFPRLILPLATIYSTLIDFGVGLAMFGVLLIITHVALTVNILLLPIWLLFTLLFAIGIGKYCAALMVSYRDVQYVLPIMTQFLMYASPVAYSVAVVPARYKIFFAINPLTGLLEAFRWSLLGRGHLNWSELAYSIIAALLVFVAGAYSFKSMERKFADVI